MKKNPRCCCFVGSCCTLSSFNHVEETDKLFKNDIQYWTASKIEKQQWHVGKNWTNFRQETILDIIIFGNEAKMYFASRLFEQRVKKYWDYMCRRFCIVCRLCVWLGVWINKITWSLHISHLDNILFGWISVPKMLLIF